MLKRLLTVLRHAPHLSSSQWAFASYIENAGGCDKIQNIVCEATNKVALTAYREHAHESERIANALSCLEKRCGL